MLLCLLLALDAISKIVNHKGYSYNSCSSFCKGCYNFFAVFADMSILVPVTYNFALPPS